MDAKTRRARKVGAKRVAQHAEAQRAKGLVRVAVWVPAFEKNQLIAYAAELRLGADLLLPSDQRVAAILRYGGSAAQPQVSKTSPSRRTAQPPAIASDVRDSDQPRPKKRRKRRSKKPPSEAKPAKKTERTQEPKTPKKRRHQRRRKAEKAARSN